MKERNIIRSALSLLLAAGLCLSMAACGVTLGSGDESETS